MTLWVIHQALSPEEEAAVTQRTHIALPFEGLPDLSMVSSPAQAMKLLKILHPDDPPETLTRRLDRFWHQYHGLNAEDFIAVPLQASQLVLMAEVTGPYEYAVGPGGSDIHRVPVKWHPVKIPFRKLAKFKEIFQPRGVPMFEVTEREARIALHGTLPYSYNRFNKFKWILAVFFLMGLVRMLMRMTEQ